MSRYTNAERAALSPTEDTTDLDAQWALMDNLEVEDAKQELRSKQDRELKAAMH